MKIRIVLGIPSQSKLKPLSIFVGTNKKTEEEETSTLKMTYQLKHHGYICLIQW